MSSPAPMVSQEPMASPAPMASQEPMSISAPVSSSVSCTSSSSLTPMPGFFQPNTQAASSDIDMSSESELKELVSTPRAVVRNSTSCAKHLKVISDLKQEVTALERQVAERSGTLSMVIKLCVVDYK